MYDYDTLYQPFHIRKSITKMGTLRHLQKSFSQSMTVFSMHTVHHSADMRNLMLFPLPNHYKTTLKSNLYQRSFFFLSIHFVHLLEYDDDVHELICNMDDEVYLYDDENIVF